MIEQYSIIDGQREIKFDLRFSNRKSLGICVTPKAEVQVTAPAGTDIERILQAVRRRMPWIIDQLKSFEEVRFTDSTPNYESGQTIKYLGRDYMRSESVV